MTSILVFGFEGTRNLIWRIGQAVKTSPSHGENRGSIPLYAASSF